MLEGKLTLPALYVLNTTTDAWAQEMALRVKAGTATVDEITRLIEFIKQNGGIEYIVFNLKANSDVLTKKTCKFSLFIGNFY